jgi:site-specific recombinase XerD
MGSVPGVASTMRWMRSHTGAVDRATIRQRKTARPVRFELTELTRQSLDDYLRITGLKSGDYLFPGRRGPDRSLTTRQYARLVSEWVSGIGLDRLKFATHSMRRTKVTLIYRRTGNLRAAQLLLGHQKIDYVPCRTISRCG